MIDFWLFGSVLLVLTGTFGDVMSTEYFLRYGGKEMNPIVTRSWLRFGRKGTALFKGLVSCGASVVLVVGWVPVFFGLVAGGMFWCATIGNCFYGFGLKRKLEAESK